MVESERDRAPARSYLTFVFVMIALGALVIGRAASNWRSIPFDYRLGVLAALTIASGRWTIKVPGRPLSFTISEVFVFAIILLFGATPATLVVAIDGLWAAIAQRNRQTHAPLTIAEPVIATWIAGQVFGGTSQFVVFLALSSRALLWLPTIAMTAAYFAVYSVLLAAGTALESGGRVSGVWRQCALLLALRQYSAASLAILAGAGVQSFEPAVFGLVAPLLVLSYAAYRGAATQVLVSRQHVNDLERLYKATMETLAVAMDTKDQVTHGHIRRVQRHALALGQAAGISDPEELKALEAAALLHDVGKLAMPDYVLNKPGSLTRYELETMKLHATKGAKILAAVEFPYPVVPIVRHHHECWNGTGYPDGLGGDDIPLGARILSIVDCFDALTSDRPYRRRLRDEVAIQMLRERSATAFDPRIVETFIKLVPQLRQQDRRAEQDDRARDLALPESSPSPHQQFRGDADGPESDTGTMLQRAGTPLLARVLESFPGAEACLFAIDPSCDSIYRVCASTAIHSAAEDVTARTGEGLSGWVAANRHTILNSDPGLDFGDQAAALGLKSAASTPLFAFGTIVGVLSVYTSERGRFSDRDARLLGELAHEIATELVRLERATAPEARSKRPRLAS